MQTLTLTIQDNIVDKVLDFLKGFSQSEVCVVHNQGTDVNTKQYDFSLFKQVHPTISEETYLHAVAMDQSGFAQQVLNTADEERWNDCL